MVDINTSWWQGSGGREMECFPLHGEVPVSVARQAAAVWFVSLTLLWFSDSKECSQRVLEVLGV